MSPSLYPGQSLHGFLNTYLIYFYLQIFGHKTSPHTMCCTFWGVMFWTVSTWLSWNYIFQDLISTLELARRVLEVWSFDLVWWETKSRGTRRLTLVLILPCCFLLLVPMTSAPAYHQMQSQPSLVGGLLHHLPLVVPSQQLRHTWLSRFPLQMFTYRPVPVFWEG